MGEAMWSNDAMSRHRYASFLYKVIQQRFEEKSTDAICIALDAEWGAGKTFFIDNWLADLRNLQHCALKFDAWKNDASEDALTGFISEFEKSIKVWIRENDIPQDHKSNLQAKGKEIAIQAGKAGIALGKGILKRYVGSEGMEALSKIGSSEEENSEKGSRDYNNKFLPTEKEIESFIEASLKTHELKISSTTKLKKSLEDFSKMLSEVSNVRQPIYIFIDELDRCRPPYAIKLLEGLKHIFNANGICFIVSTNIPQLSESVKSIYGAGFDGKRYLQRFFDFEYTLPAPDYASFSESLFGNSDSSKIFLGFRFPNGGDLLPATEPQIFGKFAEGFSLDLRSQKQVHKIYTAAKTAVAELGLIHIAYLIFLACVIHINKAKFDEYQKNKINPFELLAQLNFQSFQVFSAGREHHSITELIGWYRRHEGRTIAAVYEEVSNAYEANIPNSIMHELTANRYEVESDKVLVRISRYAEAIKMAGLIK